MKLFLCVLVMNIYPLAYAEKLEGKYELKSSKINYLVTYLIKKADGESV